jgi:hypothetical protein
MPINQNHESRKLTASEQADLMLRALSAWHQAGDTVPPEPALQPVTARMASKVQKSKEEPEAHLLHFFIFHAGAHVLAAYRVRRVNDYFMLRRMKRAPKDLVRLNG